MDTILSEQARKQVEEALNKGINGLLPIQSEQAKRVARLAMRGALALLASLPAVEARPPKPPGIDGLVWAVAVGTNPQIGAIFDTHVQAHAFVAWLRQFLPPDATQEGWASPAAAPQAPGESDARRLNASEQEYILSNPDALLILMDFHDMQQDQADSMGAECWGDELRGEELRLIGAEVVKTDPGAFSEEVRRRFLNPYPGHALRVEYAKEKIAALAAQEGKTK